MRNDLTPFASHMTFPEEMEQAAPTEAACQAAGLSVAQMEGLRSKFFCRRRRMPEPCFNNDTLLRLMAEWDLTSLAVGMLTFLPKPLPDRLSWWVGAVEVEHLFLEKPGGEVFVRDVSSTKRLWRVAKNSRNFLLALPIAAK